MKIEIEANARAIVVGKTGSGKTYLVKRLLANVPRLIVFDVKNNLKRDMELVEASKQNWRKFRLGKPIRLQIPAPILASNDFAEYYDQMFKLVYEIGNCVIYIDEIYGVTQGSQVLSPYFTALYTRGREPIIEKNRIIGGNVGIVASTQRPAHIPVFCLTESEYFFAFRLQNPDDRKKIADYTTPQIANPVQDEHGFYYYQTRTGETIYVPNLA